MLVVRKQSKSVKDDVEHLVSKDCILFDETYTTLVQLVISNVVVKVKQLGAEMLIESCEFLDIVGILNVLGDDITSARANKREINEEISIQSIVVLAKTQLVRLLVEETYVIVYDEEKIVVVIVNSICDLIRLGELLVALGCAS